MSMEWVGDNKKLEELICLCLDSLNRTHNVRLILDHYDKLDDRYVFGFNMEKQETVLVPFLFDEINDAVMGDERKHTSRATYVNMNGLTGHGKVLVGKYFIKKIWDIVKSKI